MDTRLLPYGEAGLLVELDATDEVARVMAALVNDRVSGVVDLVPAARTILVVFDPAAVDRPSIERWVTSRESVAAAPPTGRLVVIDVVYNGADLDEVAALTGLPVADVVRRHSAARYHSAFCGFAPGFAYLTGLDPALHVPRRATPRTRVPAGAVAVAGEFTGIYPRDMPGGWRIVGHTTATLWDLGRDPPALLPPSTEVQFRSVGP